MNHLITTLRIAKHLSGELASQYAARRSGPNHPPAQYPVLLAGACLASCFLIALIADPTWAATSVPVNGQTADFTLFDTIEEDAEAQSNTWFATILGLVQPTFLILATIEICWAAAIWAFEKDNLNSLAVEIIKKIMFIGFFFALLQFAPTWVPTIAGTFVEVGEQATGTEALTTDGIIATGLAVIKGIWAEAPSGFFSVLGKLGQVLVACFVTLGVIIAYVVIAAQYFTLKVESYILFAAGAIFLGLGSSSWTKEYVSKYLNYAINVGVRLLVMILILSLMLGAISRMGEGFTFDYVPLLKLLAVAVLQAILGVRAPEMAGALLNGGIGLSAGSAVGSASSAIGGLKTTAGIGAAVAATAVRAGQGAGNMAKAVSAGRDNAKQNGAGRGSATLSGLGSAVGAVARAAPGKLADVIKRTASGSNRTGGGGRGQNPGVFDQSKQSLRARGAEGADAKASADKSSAAKSGADKSGTDKSAANKSATDKSATDKAAADKGDTKANVESTGGKDSSPGSKDSSSSGTGNNPSESNVLGTGPSSTTGGASTSNSSASSESSPSSSSDSSSQVDSDSATSPSPSVASLSSSSSISGSTTSPRSPDGPRRPNKLRKAAPRPAESKHPSTARDKDI